MKKEKRYPTNTVSYKNNGEERVCPLRNENKTITATKLSGSRTRARLPKHLFQCSIKAVSVSDSGAARQWAKYFRMIHLPIVKNTWKSEVLSKVFSERKLPIKLGSGTEKECRIC